VDERSGTRKRRKQTVEEKKFKTRKMKWFGTGQQSKNRKKESEEEKMQTMNRKMEKGSDDVNR
jgi:hypothetical protein